ncbi:MAG: hypothetical protein MUE41_04585 [Gemmatimonadaceae bacterium]|nr:hypothetical protein [Gemmatimonadaceae bacterium]
MSARVRWLSLALLGVTPLALRAQGTLSTQGFGYPPGQLSARAAATAGALGEFDPLSPLNPATIVGSRRSFFTAQAAPEFRSVQGTGAASERTDTQRIPLLAAGLRVRGGTLALGVAASTLLDRSWATTSAGSVVIGNETVTTSDRGESKGAITDLRVAAAYQAHRTVRVGIAAHALTGENVVVQERTFTDTSRFGGIVDSANISYRGSAFTLGVEWTPIRGVGIAASVRRGGDIESVVRDSVRSRATVPAREGIAVRVDRFGGVALVASLARTQWTDLRALGSQRLVVVDAIDQAVGAEFEGPRLRGRAVQFRTGFRQRDLPFGVFGQSAAVSERSLGAGVGLPLAGEFGDLDIGLQRATRSARALGTERAWTVHVGFTIRP